MTEGVRTKIWGGWLWRARMTSYYASVAYLASVAIVGGGYWLALGRPDDDEGVARLATLLLAPWLLASLLGMPRLRVRRQGDVIQVQNFVRRADIPLQAIVAVEPAHLRLAPAVVVGVKVEGSARPVPLLALPWRDAEVLLAWIDDAVQHGPPHLR